MVFQVAGQCGLGALQAAKENKDWGIGVDADQGYIGKHILTSAQKKVDVGVFDTIALAGSSKWKGGTDGLYNAKNGGVGYGKVSSARTEPRRPHREAQRLDEAARGGEGQAPAHRQGLGTATPWFRVGGLSSPPTRISGRHRIPRMPERSLVLEMRHITKGFPGIVANDDIGFDLREGEVHALLGENGAGKSTLMNILYGLYHPDEGEILIKGKQVRLGSPSAAIDAGVGMVHQHFMLIPVMTVAENIVLAQEPTTAGVILDIAEAERRVRGDLRPLRARSRPARADRPASR